MVAVMAADDDGEGQGQGQGQGWRARTILSISSMMITGMEKAITSAQSLTVSGTIEKTEAQTGM